MTPAQRKRSLRIKEQIRNEISAAHESVRGAESFLAILIREGFNDEIRSEAQQKLDKARARLSSLRFVWEDSATPKKKAVRMRFYDRPSDVEPYPPTHVQRLQHFNEQNRKFWERKKQ